MSVFGSKYQFGLIRILILVTICCVSLSPTEAYKLEFDAALSTSSVLMGLSASAGANTDPKQLAE